MNRDIKILMDTIKFPNEDNNLFEECVKQFNLEQKDNEDAVRSVFEKFDTYSFGDVLVKIIVLNNRYSSGLNDFEINKDKRKKKISKGKKIAPDVISMARYISNDCGSYFYNVKDDSDIINLIEKVRYISEEYKDAYSFATKFCSWSLQDKNIPIVDSKVKGLLYRFNNLNEYTKRFTQDDLKDYGIYMRVYRDFIKECDLGEKSYKDIDKYLWQYAKNIERGTGLEIGI